MRAKKLISIALLAAIGVSAQAQIVSSQSNQVIVTEQVKEKKVREVKPILWYAKVGISYDMNRRNHDDYRGYWDDKDDGVGFEAGLGLTQTIGRKGAYWGVEAGFMTALNEDPDSGDVKKNNSVYAIPYVGWKFKGNETISIAPYIGPYASHGFMDNRTVAGVAGGVNVWFNMKYAVGVNYKRSFVTDYFQKASFDFSIAF